MPASIPARLRTWRPTMTFSSAVMWPNSFRFWKVREMPWAATWWGGRPWISRSLKRTVPSSGARKPESRSKRVVLPAPFGPMTALTVPLRTRKETSFTAWTPPNRLETPLTSRRFTLPPRAGPARPRSRSRSPRARKLRIPSGAKSMTTSRMPPKTASSWAPKTPRSDRNLSTAAAESAPHRLPMPPTATMAT